MRHAFEPNVLKPMTPVRPNWYASEPPKTHYSDLTGEYTLCGKLITTNFFVEDERFVDCRPCGAAMEKRK